jgi:c-di-AMP phosphodiesterase-like protein
MIKRRGLRNLTIIMIIMSCTWILLVSLWFSQNWDFSEALIYILVGLAGVVLSLIYESLIRTKMDIQELDKTVSCISNYVMNPHKK